MKQPAIKISHSSLGTVATLALALLLGATAAAAPVWLDELDLSKTSQGWGEAHKNKSVDGHALTLGNVVFEHGLGTHAESVLYLNLQGGAEKFSATVGVDAEVNNDATSVEFSVIGDGKTLWQSGVMRAGTPAKALEVNLTGIKNLILMVGDAGDGINYDHADWANAKFEISGARPETVAAPHEDAVILTPPAPPTPRINGAAIFGVRPGHALLFMISATGVRPMTFSADHLPKGITLDAKTGLLVGALAQPGEYVVTLHARNQFGTDQRALKIVCGDQIALTPPMGWNSWNCFAGAVSAEKVKAAADALIKSGLQNHGWNYINIDDFWQTHRDSKDPTLQGPARDAAGRILPNPRFPDMKGLADYVHSKGLKIGL